MASKNLTTAGALAAALAGGTALGHFTAPAAPPPAVMPVGIRWMGPTSDAQHPYYYAVPLTVRQGATSAVREPICWADGQAPTLDGHPYHAADSLCAAVAKCAATVEAAVPALTDTIARSNVPDAGQ